MALRIKGIPLLCAFLLHSLGFLLDAVKNVLPIKLYHLAMSIFDMTRVPPLREKAS